ncbi:MAG: Ig domain-containing protein [Bacteroidales bacterium]|nr:Ig domain-containing protein [Bacteroidales bacterium]
MMNLYSIFKHISLLVVCILMSCCTKQGSEQVAVSSITLKPTSCRLIEGGARTITPIISPGNATNQKVTWDSSDNSVAEVNEYGLVTAVKAGNATITATTVDGGKTATCDVTVEVHTIPVATVTLDITSCEIVVGNIVTLTATVTPDNATNKNVAWSSSDNSVATVEDGVVTAVKPGTATITVRTEYAGKAATCDVTVKEKTIPVDDINLDITSHEMTEGDAVTLTASIAPDNATNKNVIWSSSDYSVATVNDYGYVFALTPGSATITVTTVDGGKTATCEITVKPKIYPVDDIKLDITSHEMTEGDAVTLTASIAPDNATNKNVIWSSSDNSVATVNDYGYVFALTPGSATITVTTVDGGKTATCEVTVKSKVYPVTGVSLDRTSVELVEGDVTTLNATVYPSNATNKNVFWVSSSSAASVSDGIVMAIHPGTAVITVFTEDGYKQATCEVTVKSKFYPVTGVSLDRTSVKLSEGDEIFLNATIYPADATNQNLSWSSTDPSVASVSDGVVTANSSGTALITVTTEDGGMTASCEITVINHVTGVALNMNYIELAEGDVTTLNATIYPANATNQNLSWSSTDPSVASVWDGIVTANSPGTAVITVTTEDGGKTATCEITVNTKFYPVTGVSLDRTSVELAEGDGIFLNTTIYPANASNRNLSWSSTDPSVASVWDGIVTANSLGTAVITVTTEDGGKTATCEITVINHVTGVALNMNYIELFKGTKRTLTAKVTPENATNKGVTWMTSDSTVAIVENGMVTAIQPGTATITVKTDDLGMTSTCIVKVKENDFNVDGWEEDGTDDGGTAN